MRKMLKEHVNIDYHRTKSVPLCKSLETSETEIKKEFNLLLITKQINPPGFLGLKKKKKTSTVT